MRESLRLSRSIVLAAIAGAAGSLASRPALASPESEVTSAFDKGDNIDVHLSLQYRVRYRHGAAKRELAGLAGTDPDGPVPVVKDLVFTHVRHLLVPRLEVGVFHNVSITAALPVVLSDTRRLDFDQRADPCVYPGGSATPTCVNADNSTTIADGLLPQTGFDADNPSAGFDPDQATIFRGPTRRGLDQLNLGLTWAPMDQAHDPTKPTWKIGAEMRLSVGKVMRFDRADPSSSTGVSRGVHEVRLWTSMDRRLGWAEPFFEAWYMATVGVRSGAPLEDPSPHFGARQTGPQQTAGGRFGFDAIAWEAPGDHRLDLRMAGRLDAFFDGRGYSDLWELFAYAGDAQASGPLTLDADPTVTGVQAVSHPGVSNIENFLRLGGQAGIDAHLGPRVRLDLGMTLTWEQPHLISFAEAGVDGSDSDDVVDAGTREVNPLYAPLIDQVGHRYKVDQVLMVGGYAGLRLLF